MTPPQEPVSRSSLEPERRPAPPAAGLPNAARLAIPVLAAGFGLWAAFTGGLEAMNSDALLPVFAGLYRWTPFIWGETRFGQAVALLATPIRSPIAALLFHFVVEHALLVLFAVALARLALPRDKATAAGLTLFAFVVAVTPAHRIAFFCLTQAYIQSGSAGLAGLLLVRRGGNYRAAAGWLLLAVAFWIAPTTLFWLAPLALFAGDESPRGRRALGTAAGLAALSGLSVLLGTLVRGVPRTPVAFAPVASWPATWAGLAGGLWRATASNRWLWPLAAAILAALLLERLRRRDRDEGAALRLVTVLVTASALHLLASGTLAWVADKVATQRAGWRYAIPTQLLLAAVVPLALAARLRAPATARAAAARVAVAALAIALVVPARYGRPSIDKAKRSLQVSNGLHLDPAAHELLERGATHLLGDYWKVYPIVFRANSIAWESGDRRAPGDRPVIWPIASRAISARDLWWRDDWTTARIALLKDDPWAEPARRDFGLPELEIVESGSTIDIAEGHARAESRDSEEARR